ncbi:hypothetical protein [Corynebacterium sp. H130]|uniref:hypothetical protein n=1 Tax=Corynebacterium sp. H130 TaxID=3133444 RepID=UPI0030ABD3AC
MTPPGHESSLRSSRSELIQKGLALASLTGRTVTISQACEDTGISAVTAKKLFDSDADFVIALKRELIHHFSNTVAAPSSANLETNVRELLFSYIDFATGAPVYFNAMSNLFLAPPDFMERNSLDIHPLIILTREIVKREAPDASDWLRTTRTLALFFSIHGCAHLCTVGILRHLREGARNRYLDSAVTHVIGGISDSLETGCGLTMEPREFAGIINFPVIPPARFFPRSTPAEAEMALFRGAVEEVATVGADRLSVEGAAARADLSLSVARRFLDTDISFAKQVENHLDALSTQVLESHMASVPKGQPFISYGKANALGYIKCALMDPLGFEVYIELSSGSIVPSTFESCDGVFEMGDAFSLLVDLVRQCIVEGDGPQDTLVLYDSTLSLWSYAHGIAHGIACGPFRNLPWQEKLKYLGPLVDISIGSLIHRLDLDIRGVEMKPIQDLRAE